MKSSSAAQLRLDLPRSTVAPQTPNSSESAEEGVSEAASAAAPGDAGSATASLKAPNFGDLASIYAITARRAGRLNATKITPEEHNALLRGTSGRPRMRLVSGVSRSMKIRHATSLALVVWYLMVVPITTHAQASPISPPVDPDDVVPEAREAHRRSEAAIAANQWVLKVPHVTGMNPIFFPDKARLAWIRANPSYVRNNTAPKGGVNGGIRVWVDQPNNVREVERQVPSQLDGLPVVVEVVGWCMSVGLGKEVPKGCRDGRLPASECATTLELEGHSCEKEFETKTRCESGAAMYVRDWYVNADKHGDVVVLAPTAECYGWVKQGSHKDALGSDYSESRTGPVRTRAISN